MQRNEGNINHNNIPINHNIQIIGIQEEEEKGKGPEKIFEEIIAENSPNRERKQFPKSRKHRESHTA